MISAHAAGCIEKDNFIQFENYIRKGGELPKGELGELQNVISLLPTLLELEKPNDSVKEKIAARLIELKEETKAKLKDEKKTSFAASIKSQEISEVEKQQAQTDESANKLETKPLHSTAPKIQERGKVLKENNYAPDKSSRGILWFFAGFLFLLMIGIIIYFYDLNSRLEEEIGGIKNQLSGFQKEIESTNDFINEHLALIEFFNYRNVEIVNLSGSDVAPDAEGKLLISFRAGEALIQLKSLPILNVEESYQLWMQSKGVSYSLGLINMRPEMKFLKIRNIPNVPKEHIELFRITKEGKSGAEIPQGSTYLYGVIPKEHPQPSTRRR